MECFNLLILVRFKVERFRVQGSAQPLACAVGLIEKETLKKASIELWKYIDLIVGAASSRDGAVWLSYNYFFAAGSRTHLNCPILV